MFIYILGYAPNSNASRHSGMAGQFEVTRSPERMRQVVQEHLLGSVGFEYDYRIVTLEVPDDLDEDSIIEQLENFSEVWCPPSIDKEHVPHHHDPDWSSVTYNCKNVTEDGLIIDVNCKVCGLSGSTRVPSEVLNW